MVDARDPGTLQLPLVVRRGRGRPRKAGGAMTAAQRQAKARARRRSHREGLVVDLLRQVQGALAALETGDLSAVRDRLEGMARNVTEIR